MFKNLKKKQIKTYILGNFSEAKAAYDFLNIHIQKIESEAEQNSFKSNNNEDYQKLLEVREELYTVMEKLIKTAFF